VKNFFAYGTAAERYADYRPFFHPLVVEKIKAVLQLNEPLRRALDVGCGTGQSTLALTAIARQVVGTDAAAEMLAQAVRHPSIEYLQSPAEALPVANNSVQLITVSLAFHWFDRTQFLSEAYRVLETARWLVIYNNGFYGTMEENPEFEQWNRSRYLERYPTPPRHNQLLGQQDAQQYGFRLVHQESYGNDVSFTVENLASYLTTQSNVITAVEQGTESIKEAYDWLQAQIAPMFSAPVATFAFGGSILYLRKL
jgi:ubiquinone/menaquinone biosynthesis C-methylase UbiE